MAALLSYIASVFFKTAAPERTNKYRLPLPRVCHFILDETTIAGRDVFIIGDVHGCYGELCELLNLTRRHSDNVLFVFVGDMINKGPKNVDVIRMVRELGEHGNAFAVRGNHEECVLREVRDSGTDAKYQLQEKYFWIKDLSEADVQYIQQLPYTISIPSLKVTVLHAGLLPGIPLEQQKLNNLTNMRNIVVKDSVENTSHQELEGLSKTDRGESWISFLKGPEHVYFGHDARRGLQISDFATGLDTGCVYGGTLTGSFANGSKAGMRLCVKAKQCYARD